MYYTLVVLSFISLFVLLVILFGWMLSETGYSGQMSDHFDGKQFKNPSGKPANDIKEVFKFMGSRKPDKWQRNYETFVRSEAIPIPTKETVQITFINHSTFLIQYQGVNILTDPIWSKRCSPFQFMGPARMRPPGIRFEDLPKIDLVLVSHNHYDHMDKLTIQRLTKKWNPTFVTSLGNKATLERWGCTVQDELDWWQETSFGDLSIKATPCNHFSSRGIFDRDQTLWCGFLLTKNNHKLYFAGDSGYSDVFPQIGKQVGTIDVSLIPIGAYLPVWFMSPIHISPKEAVQVHIDVNSKQSIAMHFGTFALADDGPFRPIKELAEALANAQIDPAKFIVPEEGKSIVCSLSAS